MGGLPRRIRWSGGRPTVISDFELCYEAKTGVESRTGRRGLQRDIAARPGGAPCERRVHQRAGQSLSPEGRWHADLVNPDGFIRPEEERGRGGVTVNACEQQLYVGVVRDSPDGVGIDFIAEGRRRDPGPRDDVFFAIHGGDVALGRG